MLENQCLQSGWCMGLNKRASALRVVPESLVQFLVSTEHDASADGKLCNISST